MIWDTAPGSTSERTEAFPPLPFDEWRNSKETLHRFTQIVGKIRLALTPPLNHWWHVTLYVTSRGLTTSAIPYKDKDQTFTIDFDFIDHRLKVVSSTGETSGFALYNGLSVAQFYQQLLATLHQLGIEVTIAAKPYGLSTALPFAEDQEHALYDPTYITRYWQVLRTIDGIFKEFSGRFTGKQSPVHLYWHSFDIAMGRFSGKRAPDRPGARMSDRQAYSHEIISFGWWPGDDKVQAPAFYSYTAPEPDGLAERPLASNAEWVDVGGSHMAMLMYDDVRTTDNPRQAVLDFLESAYQAGAGTAGWDIEALRTVTFEQGDAKSSHETA